MGEVAKQNDLQAHIKGDGHLVHGIWDLVLSKVAGVYNALWRDNTNDDAADVYFQSGKESCAHDTAVSVTFDVAFSAAPRVVATVNTSSTVTVFLRVYSISTSGFTVLAYNYGAGSAVDVDWIAIGRKDR